MEMRQTLNKRLYFQVMDIIAKSYCSEDSQKDKSEVDISREGLHDQRLKDIFINDILPKLEEKLIYTVQNLNYTL